MNHEVRFSARTRFEAVSPCSTRSASTRNILKASGVHVYLDSDDVLLTDGQFLSITASSEGAKTVRLPAPRRVLALPDNQVVAEKADHIEIDLAHGETRLYRLAPPQ